MNRVESQMSGMQSNLYSTANDVILMRNEHSDESRRTKEVSPAKPTTLERRASLPRDVPERMESAASRLPRAQQMQVPVANMSGPPTGRQSFSTSHNPAAIMVDSTYQRSPTPP